LTGSVVARRYANALFSLGKKSNQESLEKYGKTLTSLEELFASSPVLGKIFKSPVVTISEKRKIIGKILDKLKADKVTSNFCMLLADKNRLSYLHQISAYYSVLLDEEKGVVRGKLLTAISLDAKKQGEIKAMLEKKSAKSLELVFDVDKSILGGIVLKIGDRVMDASLRAQLAILRDKIKRGE